MKCVCDIQSLWLRYDDEYSMKNPMIKNEYDIIKKIYENHNKNGFTENFDMTIITFSEYDTPNLFSIFPYFWNMEKDRERESVHLKCCDDKDER